MEGPECQNEGCGSPLGLEEALTCRGVTNPAICDAGSSEKAVRQWGGLGKQQTIKVFDIPRPSSMQPT